MKITIFSGPYPVDEHMGGVGLRLWELAQCLADGGDHVTIVTPRPSSLAWPGVTCVTFDSGWRRHVDDADAIVTSDQPDTSVMLHAYRRGVLSVVENAPPIEHLHYAHLRASADPQTVYDDLADRYRLQLWLADHLLVRSEPERAATLGALVATGRLTWQHHRHDPTLSHLISLLPIGFNAAADAHAHAATCAPDAAGTDLVWNGGVWEYCEPSPMWPALALLRDQGHPVTMRLLYPPADLTIRATITRAIGQHGLADLVSIPDAAVPHHQRDACLLAARAIVCTGRPGPETQTCHRLRLRDAWLYRLPVVIDHYGASGDLVTRHRIGAAVDPADSAALARALLAAVQDGPTRSGYLAALEAARPAFTFEANLHGLRRVLATGRHAPDVGTPSHQRVVDELLARRPELATTPTPIF